MFCLNNINNRDKNYDAVDDDDKDNHNDDNDENGFKPGGVGIKMCARTDDDLGAGESLVFILPGQGAGRRQGEDREQRAGRRQGAESRKKTGSRVKGEATMTATHPTPVGSLTLRLVGLFLSDILGTAPSSGSGS